MNARQKAKMYKRKYEQLRQCTQSVGKPIVGVQAVPLLAIRAERLINMDEMCSIQAAGEMAVRELRKMFATQFIDQVSECVGIEVKPQPSGALVTATVKVIDMAEKGGSNEQQAEGEAGRA